MTLPRAIISYHISFSFFGENKKKNKVWESGTVTWQGIDGVEGIVLTLASNLGLTSMKRHRPVSGTCSRLLRNKRLE